MAEFSLFNMKIYYYAMTMRKHSCATSFSFHLAWNEMVILISAGQIIYLVKLVLPYSYYWVGLLEKNELQWICFQEVN